MPNTGQEFLDQDQGSMPYPPEHGNKRHFLRSASLWVFVILAGLAFWVGRQVEPTWTADKVTLDVQHDAQGDYYIYRGKPEYLPEVIPQYIDSPLHPQALKQGEPDISEAFAQEQVTQNGVTQTRYYQLLAKRHWGFWSLLPAVVAIVLCWLTKEPISALLGGIVVGAFLLGQYDLTEEVLVPNLAKTGSAQILLLYLWLLGGLMGVWSRMGAPKAFAELMTRYFVKGPRSARLVSWALGLVFFQGGTVSTVLVGTTVKPLADQEKISHEELSYIVDSTASPIASILAFNAWPGYIQAFIFVSGAGFLATEADRLSFFFQSIPLHFYAIFAVLGTFLLSIDKLPWMSKNLKEAIVRARTEGLLDAPGSTPLSAKELHVQDIPPGYTPHVMDFFAPLLLLIGLAIGTFITGGSPNVRWAFGAALLLACLMALFRGMSLNDLIDGIGNGMKGVVMGSVILLLAITLGSISKATGGGNYLVELLGTSMPYWLLPVILQLLTIVIAFSTGTSWGTYAVAFPLAMPLAWAMVQGHDLSHPLLYMMICFSAVMDGSVFGDQCSPISDTTVLSAMCTGCDLMDHVRTQLPQAAAAATLAALGWTALAVFVV